MANYVSDQIDFYKGNSSLGGLQGSPNFGRSTNIKGGLQQWRFTFTNAVSTNAGTVITLAQNDTLDLAYLDVQVRFLGLFLYWGAFGAGATLSVGRVDPNNSANNSAARYLSALDISAAQTDVVLHGLLSGDQLGGDEVGDQTTGQKPPSFGAAPITVQATFGGAVPATGKALNGFIMFVNLNQA
jgi:hypothetical protein